MDCPAASGVGCVHKSHTAVACDRRRRREDARGRRQDDGLVGGVADGGGPGEPRRPGGRPGRAVRPRRLARRQRHVHPAAHPGGGAARVVERGLLHRRRHPGGQHRGRGVRRRAAPPRRRRRRRPPGARLHLRHDGPGLRLAAAHGLLLPGGGGGGGRGAQRAAAAAGVRVRAARLRELSALRAVPAPLPAHLPRLLHGGRGPERAAAQRAVPGAGRGRRRGLRRGRGRHPRPLHAAARLLDADVPARRVPAAGRQRRGLRPPRPAPGLPARPGRGQDGRGRRQAARRPRRRASQLVRVRRPAGRRGRAHVLLQRPLPQRADVLVRAVRHARLPPRHQPGRHGQPAVLLPALLRGGAAAPHHRGPHGRHPGRGRLHPGGRGPEPNPAAGRADGRAGPRGAGVGRVHGSRLLHEAGHRLGLPPPPPRRPLLVGCPHAAWLAARRRPRLRPAQLHRRLPRLPEALPVRGLRP